MNKKTLALWGYVALSAAFILFSAWQYLAGEVYQRGASQGMTQAVTQLIEEAGKCQPFEVFAGQTKIKLQMLDCTAQNTVENQKIK